MGFDAQPMDIRKLKEGTLKRYKSGFLGSKWKECFVVLFSDSTFSIYSKQGDSKPDAKFLLKDVAPYICVGLMTDRMPTKRPDLPDGCSVHHLVGIGMDPRAEKVHWILFASDSDLESWFAEIVKTLPKPANPPPAPGQPGQPPSQQPSAPQPPASGGFVPPAQYPSNPYPSQPQPPPYQAGGGYNPGPQGGGYNPGPQGYGGGSHQTTVIVDRGGSSYGGGGSGLGSGLGFGSGMLMGSLLGYGVGSFFTPHYSSGFGGFGGYGGGFGGGYPGVGGGYPSIQDNDTYVTNNYYNTNDNDSQSTQPQNNEPHNDYNDDGGYDDGGYDAGGFDDGGGFDGGDW